MISNRDYFIFFYYYNAFLWFLNFIFSLRSINISSDVVALNT